MSPTSLDAWKHLEQHRDAVSAMHRALVAKGYVATRVTEAGAPHEWGPWNRRLPGLLEHFRQGVSACD